jgi:hypothetical protein
MFVLFKFFYLLSSHDKSQLGDCALKLIKFSANPNYFFEFVRSTLWEECYMLSKPGNLFS